MGKTDKIPGEKVSQTRFFKEAKAKALELAKSPDKLRNFIEKAREKAQDKKSGPIGEVYDSLMLFFRLLIAYTKGEYREIPWKSLIAIIGSIVYFVMPTDFIPDFILAIGFIDDAALIGWTVKSLAKDIEQFSTWEQGKAPESRFKSEADKASQHKHQFRGSRKHILDWVEQEEFPDQFNQLLKPTGAIIKTGDEWRPIGYKDPKEARIHQFGKSFMPDAINWNEVLDWWLAHKSGANTPNWDLISTCTIKGEKGLVLVEAKANAAELKIDGKPLKPNASKKSKENHKRIGLAIEEANTALNKKISGINISRDRNYQLCNRIAFTWKVASLGLPVVLMYLGFTGDKGIADVGEPIRDHAHWGKLMALYTSELLPKEFAGRWIDCGPAAFQMIVRSQKVIKPSSPKNKLK